MITRNKFQVFEHSIIRHGERYSGVHFTESQFNALVRFNDQHHNKYFTIVHRGIKFTQYVGVIQVGNLVIEILPKMDRHPPDTSNKKFWRDVLLDMLRACHLLRIETMNNAHLKLRSNSILDMYVELFINEVEALLRQGLTKKYRRIENNQPALRGALQFQQHFQKNLIHRERFYIRFHAYDYQHLINQILCKTIRLLRRIIANPLLLDKIERLKLCFPLLPDVKVDDATFNNLQYNRKSEKYRTSLEIARLLLLNYSPDIRSGCNDVLAILFDMNQLFEEYIYRQIKKYAPETISVSYQSSKRFWGNHRIRPDIVLQTTKYRYIIDTKWKVLNDFRPSDSDLKQMFVYNHYFKAQRSVLLYPWAGQDTIPPQNFFNETHECQLAFIKLFENGRLNKNSIREFLKALEL